jgi:hypothetical protein
MEYLNPKASKTNQNIDKTQDKGTTQHQITVGKEFQPQKHLGTAAIQLAKTLTAD